MHQATEKTLRHFTYQHLSPDLAAVSQPFHELANNVANNLPEDPQTTICLQKLLEAKDAAVRAELSRVS